MAELGNLTYNITVNDTDLASIKEEIASLRATLLVQEAKLECQAAKYKEMLAEQEAVGHARKENWSLELQRNSRGECICCGIGMGSTLEGSPFTVQGGQVYVNKTTVCDTTKESSVVTLDEDGVLKAFDENGTLRVRIQLPFKEKQ